jgi:hypothetical protein
VPTLPEKPANGVVQMLIVPTDVAAAGKCPARKVPSIALIYTPNKDFVGVDAEGRRRGRKPDDVAEL